MQNEVKSIKKDNEEINDLGEGLPVEAHVNQVNIIVPILIVVIGNIIFLATMGGFGLIFGIILFILCIPLFANATNEHPITKYEGNCPYCNETVVSNCFVDGSKVKCWSCGKMIGCYDKKLYKITDKNKKHFLTTDEKNEEILKNAINSNNDSNKLKQLKELKELLDMDAITKEEYEEKKKELLK